MSKGKLPFSEVSHIDCRTLEFATTLRGGYGKDENEMKVVSMLKKEQAAVQAEVAEKEGEMKCERYQCKKTVVQLVKIEMEVGSSYISCNISPSFTPHALTD